MLKELLHPMGWLLVEFSFPRPAPEETVDTADLHDSLVRWAKIFAPIVSCEKFSR